MALLDLRITLVRRIALPLMDTILLYCIPKKHYSLWNSCGLTSNKPLDFLAIWLLLPKTVLPRVNGVPPLAFMKFFLLAKQWSKNNGSFIVHLKRRCGGQNLVEISKSEPFNCFKRHGSFDENAVTLLSGWGLGGIRRDFNLLDLIGFGDQR